MNQYIQTVDVIGRLDSIHHKVANLPGGEEAKLLIEKLMAELAPCHDCETVMEEDGCRYCAPVGYMTDDQGETFQIVHLPEPVQ